MKRWKEPFKYDPLVPLISSKNKAIQYFTKRDLLEEEVEPIQSLWILQPAIKIINKQQEDGSWRYSAWKAKLNEPKNYNLLEYLNDFTIDYAELLIYFFSHVRL